MTESEYKHTLTNNLSGYFHDKYLVFEILVSLFIGGCLSFWTVLSKADYMLATAFRFYDPSFLLIIFYSMFAFFVIKKTRASLKR